MSSIEEETREPAAPRRAIQALVLVIGLLVTQFILYGPALLGRTLLLPLDCLAHPNLYLPDESLSANTPVTNWVFSDAVLQTELDRVFAAEQIREGRLPLWNPYNYCGVPFLANNNAAVFSPFMIPSYLAPGPVTIAWTVLLRALVAGIGAYLFFRVTLRLSWWPSLIGAWSFPVIGYLVMVSWIHHASVISLLPWMLIAVDAAVRRPGGIGGPGLALATALVLFSGKLDTSAHVLLASGFYALWCLFDQWHSAKATSRRLATATLVLVAAWGLGFGTAAIVILPTKAYADTSARIEARAAGQTDFPVQGIQALPQVILPLVFGRGPIDGKGLSNYTAGKANVLESGAGAYAGFLTPFILVPLAWTNRRRRNLNLFWAVAFLISAAPILGIPLLKLLYELPVLDLLQNNRMSFFAGWSLLVTGVIGLDALQRNPLATTRWLLLPALILLVAAQWWLFRAIRPPEIFYQVLGHAGSEEFRMVYLKGCLLSVLGLALLALWHFAPRRLEAAHRILGALILIEIVANAHGFIPQSDPALYYPTHPAIESIQQAGPGRFCGVDNMLPNVNRAYGLSDIRGYDGSDPHSLVRLLEIANPSWPKFLPYAYTHDFRPIESPIMRMLNLRYRIVPGKPNPGTPALTVTGNFWVHDDPTALPRPYVPRSIVPVPDAATALDRVAAPSFNPAKIAFVENAPPLPPGPIEGRAIIVKEVPGHLRINFDMATPGLVVLNDLWFEGWRATIDGEPSEVHRVNSALQGVFVPAGKGVLEMRYRPTAFTRGMTVSGISLVLLGLWAALNWRQLKATPNST